MSYTVAEQNMWLDTVDFSEEMCAEVNRAREKFPSSDMVLAALMEEVGELAQAIMERERTFHVEPMPHMSIGGLQHDIYKWTRENIRKEAIQVAAMACRIAVEGDPRFPSSQKGD